MKLSNYKHLQRIYVYDSIQLIKSYSEKRIVSIAKKTRETDCLCSISAVYTIEKERKKGFSKKIVSFLTNYIVTNHKIAYLFVDKNNPISNHLYQSIGYVYDKPQFEFIYQVINNFSK